MLFVRWFSDVPHSFRNRVHYNGRKHGVNDGVITTSPHCNDDEEIYLVVEGEGKNLYPTGMISIKTGDLDVVCAKHGLIYVRRDGEYQVVAPPDWTHRHLLLEALREDPSVLDVKNHCIQA